MKIEEVAEVCFNVNKSICESIGDYSQANSYNESADWVKTSTITGIEFILANPDSTSESVHEEWCQFKLAEGWVYGEVKDVDLKTHPCLVSYEELPTHQKSKDYVFRSIVNSLSKYITN